MTDYAGALQNAVFDRLKAQIGSVPVFQHVPDNHKPPIIIVADINGENQADKEDVLIRFDLTIVAITAQPGRLALSAIQGQVMDALHRWLPAATNDVAFGELNFLSSSGREISGSEGEPYYYGEQLFSVYAQDA